MSNFLVKDGDKANWEIPNGYPYKESSKVVIEWDGNTDGLKNVGELHMYLVSDTIISNDAYKQGTVYLSDGSIVPVASFWDDIVVDGNVTDDFCCYDAVCVIRKAGINIIGFTFDTPGVYFLKRDNMYVTKFTTWAETTHPISSDFLPLATPTAAGAMKQAAAVANVTAAPTAEEFNALLKSLRDAGILATS